MKEKVQSFGRFLSAMVMPNIGAFIAWGLLTALFIEAGWLPNAQLATIVGPMLSYVLPLLIAYTGGRNVGGPRGAVMGAIATIGVICGQPDTTMLMGAMVMGPVAGLVIKKFDEAVKGKVKPGFEMLVDNFSVGILGLLLSIVGFYLISPVMAALLGILAAGTQVLIDNSLLPLVSVFVEPAKVLFLNNAINHGIFTPLGAKQAEEFGKSVFYMIETNPGAGTGVLCAYWMWSKDKATKDSAPGALIVHLFGGIHEIYFPYVLMNPLLLLATIGGSVSAMIYNTIFDLGLTGPAAPGSIIAFTAMAPKGSTLAVLFSAVIAAVVSFAIATPIIKFSEAKGSLEDAQNQMNDMKAASKGQEVSGNVDLSAVDTVVFACDAGMGSSAMGASVLQRKFEGIGVKDIKVEHYSVSEVPSGTRYVVCHQDLVERAKKSAPGARIVTITNFMNAPEYDMIVGEISAARSGVGTLSSGQQSAAKEAVSSDSKVLLKKNIILNRPTTTKEEVIKDIGRIMARDGYATERYTEAMFKKEEVFNTAIGNNLAVPHGIEEMRSEILGSGLTIFTYPDGVDWGDGNTVKLVVGIASTGNEHIEVLGRIAEVCETEEAVDNILKMNVDQVYNLFKR